MHHFGGRRRRQLRLELGVDRNHQGDNLLKLKLSFAIFALALTPLAAPLLAPSHPLIALLIRSFFSRLCHQDPGRSFVVDGSPIAVCVRCLGIYCGAAVASLLDMGKVPARRLLAIALLLQAGSGAITPDALEERCHLMAQRMTVLYGLNSPEFVDKSLFRNFIDLLIRRNVIQMSEDKKLMFGEPLLGVAADAQVVLSEQIRHSILQVTLGQ